MNQKARKFKPPNKPSRNNLHLATSLFWTKWLPSTFFHVSCGNHLKNGGFRNVSLKCMFLKKSRVRETTSISPKRILCDFQNSCWTTKVMSIALSEVPSFKSAIFLGILWWQTGDLGIHCLKHESSDGCHQFFESHFSPNVFPKQRYKSAHTALSEVPQNAATLVVLEPWPL